MASNTAVTEEGEPDVIDDDGTGQKKELVVARSATMEPIPVVSVPGGHGLDVARRRDMIQSPQGTPERILPFPRNAESKSSPMSERSLPEPNSTLQDLLNRSKHKAGLSVICCCTTPMTAKHIEGCTSHEKMRKCFEDDLGFSTKLFLDPSKEEMRQLLHDLETLMIPDWLGKKFRFFFYFFGHGNEQEICLTDGNFPRNKIVTTMQNIDRSYSKILLIDSCRLTPSTTELFESTSEMTTTTPAQATRNGAQKSALIVGSLDDGSGQEGRGDPRSMNTLVIYSTYESSEAFYAVKDLPRDMSDEMKNMRGCGLMTFFFTKLVSTRNEPLAIILIEVQEKVVALVSNAQMPEFKHFLLRTVNLLAESKGKERVKPKIQRVFQTTNSTSVQWMFCLDRVKKFRVICIDGSGKGVDMNARQETQGEVFVAELNNKFLVPETTYHIKVLAEYEDGFESESEPYPFTSPSHGHPTEITITPLLSDQTKVTLCWNFSGNDSNLSEFLVEVDGEEVTRVHCSDRKAKISRLLPFNTVKVVAIFEDGYRTECHVTPSTEKDKCLLRIVKSPKFIIFSLSVICLLSLLFSLSYIPYLIYLKGSTNVQTHYASTNTAIDCGTGNSRTHNGINLEGSLQRGDSLDGVINAWLVRRNKLKLYSQKTGPYIDGYRPYPGDHTVQLSGWNVYLWVRSIISGYCCVQNENGTERTASIFLFTSFDNALNFRSGGRAENYILTETLTIPQDSARCFTVFGPDKPLTVNESSYHIFVVQFSADNMNFSSEIDYLQNYVNTSDYSHPHEFQYDSQTHLQFPTGPEHPTDYIAICKAPDYVTLKTAHPEAESIHIQSWGSQYWWDTLYIVAVSITLFMCVYTAIACLCFCMLQYFREKCLYFLNGCHTIVFHIFHCPRCTSSFQFCHCPRCDYERIN